MTETELKNQLSASVDDIEAPSDFCSTAPASVVPAG